MLFVYKVTFCDQNGQVIMDLFRNIVGMKDDFLDCSLLDGECYIVFFHIIFSTPHNEIIDFVAQVLVSLSSSIPEY